MRTLSLSDEHGLMKSVWVASSKAVLGWARAHRGGAKGAVDLIEEGLATWRSTGSTLFAPYHLGLAAEAAKLRGELDECLARLNEALDVAEKGGEHWWDAELHRLKGETTLQSTLGDRESAVRREAESCFEQALEVARTQSAKSLELRAATSLARLWQQQGKQTEAHELLSGIYNWFTEGFDTKDLKDAKPLLEDLG